MATAKSGLIDSIVTAFNDHMVKINSFNEQYKTDESAENGPRALFQRANELLEADKASAQVRKARDAYESALTALSDARNGVVTAVASQLGIEAQVEKPKPTKDEYEAAKKEREGAQNALSTLTTLAEYSPDLKDEVSAFVEANKIPSLARPAQERREGPVAPKYRVDVTWTDGEGNSVTEAGFTKTALSAKNVTAADLRSAYENAGGKGDGTFDGDVTVGDRTFHVKDRQKQSN